MASFVIPAAAYSMRNFSQCASLGYSRFFRDYRSIELSVLAIVSIVAEVLFIIIKTIRNMAGDEDKTQMWKQMGHSVFNNLMYLCIVVDVFWM